MFRQKCNDSHIRLSYENLTVRDVRMRSSDIWSILTNLLKNAFDSIVEKKTGDRRIDIKVEYSERKEIKMTVSDSGTGIPPERQHIVFDAGYTTKLNGMGVGLFWVRRLVSNMNGTIGIDSPNEYGGTSFLLAFPDKMK
jgi:sensor histidine kinase regulating citrate/malate metabolism